MSVKELIWVSNDIQNKETENSYFRYLLVKYIKFLRMF